MNQFSWTIAPYLPSWALIVMGVAGLGLVIWCIFAGMRGSFFRLAALGVLLLALANPSLVQEEREQLPTIVALISDRSDSQQLDGRDDQTEQATEIIKSLLAKFPQFEVRAVNATSTLSAENDGGTTLFSSLSSSLQDVAPDRVGAAIFITDGQVHDIPESANKLGLSAPLHAIITGSETDKDRRIVLRKAPRFGIVGESQEIVYSVIEEGFETEDPVEVRVFSDGELIAVEDAFPGEDVPFVFDIPHGGKNIIEFHVAPVKGEITDVNNRTFAAIEGIRENLRVLLVSGEPHAGERTWRNLLKSDGSVDLVHFTILRPPEKQDGTPITELSLIAFPTRELFIEKIDEFDLIIFDRYKLRRVLPLLYFDNIARYLTDGGAILVAAGPEHAGNASIHHTPLGPVLPIEPTGNTIDEPFKPRVSDAGRRHPVTRDLDGMGSKYGKTPPEWSRWFRVIEGVEAQGDTLITDENERPLLVLNRPGEGRVAVLMSDHVWLWARGFEGGGPHTQLLRRLAHWLMKEPELAEEALKAEANGKTVTITRQSMGDAPGPVDIVLPSGERARTSLGETSDGVWRTEYLAETFGLYRFANGELTTLTHVGPANPKEYAEIVSTEAKLSPVVKQTRGATFRTSRSPTLSDLPRIVPVSGSGNASGNDWMGIRETSASRLIGVRQVSLFSGLLGLAALLLTLGALWAREGR